MTLAYWCVLLAAISPVLIVGLAKMGGSYDNARPRDLPHADIPVWRKRAHGAHLNAIEAFAPFAVAVILAQLAGVDYDRIDMLALGFIAARVIYTIFYIAGQPMLRSVFWTIAFAFVVWLYILAIGSAPDATALAAPGLVR